MCSDFKDSELKYALLIRFNKCWNEFQLDLEPMEIMDFMYAELTLTESHLQRLKSIITREDRVIYIRSLITEEIQSLCPGSKRVQFRSVFLPPRLSSLLKSIETRQPWLVDAFFSASLDAFDLDLMICARLHEASFEVLVENPLVCREWRTFARALGLSEPLIRALADDSSSNYSEKLSSENEPRSSLASDTVWPRLTSPPARLVPAQLRLWHLLTSFWAQPPFAPPPYTSAVASFTSNSAAASSSGSPPPNNQSLVSTHIERFMEALTNCEYHYSSRRFRERVACILCQEVPE